MKHLGSIGAFLALAGIISIVLHFIGYNLRLLMWIDLWGAGVGWAIRIGLIVLGAALFFVGRLGDSGGEEGEEPDDDD